MKRQKVHTRSRGGCLTCKKRKLKCDEAKPTCHRCTIEGRECDGYSYDADNGEKSISESILESSNLPDMITLASPNSLSSTRTTSAVNITEETCNTTSPHKVVLNFSKASHQQGNDGHTSIFDSLLSNMWSDALNADHSIDWNWMNVDPLGTSREFIEAEYFQATSDTPDQHRIRSHSMSESMQPSFSPVGLNGDRRGERLQSKLESLCTTQPQWIGLTHFFNHVAQCFHIIPAEANRWRLVFGTLSLQSDIIFRLVVAVGLASFSHHSSTSYRAIGHAHMTYSLRVWHQLVEDEKKEGNQCYSAPAGSSRPRISKRTLEILASAVLIGHFEQFDSGIAHECNKCLLAALDLVDAILQSQASGTGCGDTSIDVDSSFRFLTRVLLWWETFSGTMGPASGLPLKKLEKIFMNVRCWEEDTTETVIDSTQCVTGWPLDLLEAVARITRIAREIRIIQCEKRHENCRWFSKMLQSDRTACGVPATDAKYVQYLLSEARATESQMRSCRPKTILQDSVSAAELRFVLFELLQAGASVYYARAVSGRLEGVSKDIQAILRFLHSPTEVQTPIAGPDIRYANSSTQAKRKFSIVTTAAAAAAATATATASSTSCDSQARHRIPEWNNLWAADGHAIWAYLQATIAASADQQANCRAMIKSFDEIAKCGAIHTFLELVEEIWLRSRIEKETSTEECSTAYRLDNLFRDVTQQRRWKQLLIF